MGPIARHFIEEGKKDSVFDGWDDQNKTRTHEEPIIQIKGVEGAVKLAEDPESLPWARYLWQQCKAVREPRGGGKGHFGRCDLIRNHNGIDHALDRGMETPRWSTDWTG